MWLGELITVLCFMLITIRIGVKKKLNRYMRENAHERKLSMAAQDEKRMKKADRKYKRLLTYKLVYMAAGLIEAVLLFLVFAWAIYLVGAFITGHLVLLGYPVW
ncbi:hypothetical protein FACS1894111_05930 [Clostridia bacterium]|nr:hypothetical protein FACS1894111_05930 [Clostridia bacterium]